MKLQTWLFELAVVFFVLAITVLLTNGSAVEWIAVGAVTISFAHGQVSERLAEKESRRAVAEVECHSWAKRYFIGKEVLWFLYFGIKGSYAALVGVVLFLLYPLWRKLWRRFYPL